MLPSYLLSRISVSLALMLTLTVCSVIHYGVTLLSASLRWQRSNPTQLFLASPLATVHGEHSRRAFPSAHYSD